MADEPPLRPDPAGATEYLQKPLTDSEAELYRRIFAADDSDRWHRRVRRLIDAQPTRPLVTLTATGFVAFEDRLSGQLDAVHAWTSSVPSPNEWFLSARQADFRALVWREGAHFRVASGRAVSSEGGDPRFVAAGIVDRLGLAPPVSVHPATTSRTRVSDVRWMEVVECVRTTQTEILSARESAFRIAMRALDEGELDDAGSVVAIVLHWRGDVVVRSGEDSRVDEALRAVKRARHDTAALLSGLRWR